MGTDRTGLRPDAPPRTPGSPTRTCVGCRGTDSWSALLRVVAETDDTGTTRLTPDPRHRLPGRGAWLHPTGECLEQALRRRAFGRALRTSAALDSAAVRAHVESLVEAVATGREQESTNQPSAALGTDPESGFDR